MLITSSEKCPQSLSEFIWDVVEKPFLVPATSSYVEFKSDQVLISVLGQYLFQVVRDSRNLRVKKKIRRQMNKVFSKARI